MFCTIPSLNIDIKVQLSDNTGLPAYNYCYACIKPHACVVECCMIEVKVKIHD